MIIIICVTLEIGPPEISTADVYLCYTFWCCRIADEKVHASLCHVRVTRKSKTKKQNWLYAGARSFMLAGTAALFWIRWISLRCHITSLSQNRRWNIIGITKAFLTVADHQSAHIDWSTKKSTLRDIPQSGWKLDKNPCHYYLTAAVTTESNCDQYQTLYAYMSRHFQCARIN
jgi:hypothetical protein